MKLKVNFGEGGIKGFLILHVEKFVLGVALLLVVYFVYSSATQNGLESDKRPDFLKRDGESAVTHISTSKWDEIAPEREKKVEDFPAKTDEARAKINESDYALSMIWNKPNIPRRAKRGDPKFFNPTDLEVEAVVAAVALNTPTFVDPFAADKTAVAKPTEAKPKPKPKKPTRRKPAAGPADYAEGIPGMEAFADPAGATAAMPPDATGSAANYAMGGNTGGGGLEGGRTVGAFYKEHYLAGNGWQAGIGQGGAQGAKVAGRAYAVVAVKALVPYEKQWEEYERALANATGYSPQQDVPKYLYFVAERADVTANPNADPAAGLQWTLISNSYSAMNAATQYAGFPNELADERYLEPGKLTMPIPPLLLRSYQTMAVHSEVPRRQPRSQQDTTEKKPAPTGDVTAPTTGDISEGIQGIPKVGPGGNSPYGSMGAEGMGMYSGGEGSADSYSDQSGMPGMYGAGGQQQQQPLVKTKMIRFFDFTAEPGKSYRYRVRVVLEDPNRPRDAKADPNRRILEDAVVKRLQQVEAEDADYEKKNGKPRRTFYVQTDWSEASRVVTIEKPGNFLAGSVVAPKMTKLGNEGPEIEAAEASGKLVAVVWDKTRAVEVPAERTVHRGTVLSFRQNSDVMHPLSQQIKTIENYDFETGAFVADIRGGDLLYEDRKKENLIHAPGEMLIIDGEGNLLVRNEVDDVEDYRRVLFIDDSVGTIATGGMSSPSNPFGGMPMGMEGAAGMPGMSPPGMAPPGMAPRGMAPRGMAPRGR